MNQGDMGKTNLRLVDVPRVLRERFNLTTSYWQLYKAVIDGRAPAVRDGRHWLIPEDDLPRVAEVLAARAA